MPVDSRNCPTCDAPLPEAAKFCPSCGAASPIEISRATGEARWPTAADADELAYRQDLQQTLGDAYQLRELIGRGGFGVVYAAWDVRLEREVAVKALRHDLFPTRLLLERFQREARAVARLRHPHIIPIYAVGGDEGLACMIMPRIEGESLSAVLAREQRLPIAEARRILLEAASALHAAHRRGVVHRDVKPENILLEGDERRVLLVDFGIAKAVASRETGLTGTGMVIGTPDYMSPEQASGDVHTIDHRTDQYALAVVGYRMLTGRLPLEAATSWEVFHRRRVEAPPPASAQRPEVPTRLSDALQRAMAGARDERFRDMEEFAAALGGGDGGATQPGVGRAGLDEAPVAAVSDPRAPVISWRLAALAALGALLFALLYRAAFPPPLDAPSITRDEALRIGRAFLLEEGDVPPAEVHDLDEAVRFFSRDWDRWFLESALGPDSARRWVSQERPWLGRWLLRWFQPQRVEGWWVGLSGDGAIDFFQHTVDDAAPGARLDAPAAQAVAEAFLQARGWSLGDLEAQESSSQQRPNRTDHRFTWQKRGSQITWRETDRMVSPASIRVEVQLHGEEIGVYQRFLWWPEEVFRRLRMETAERIRGLASPILLVGGPLLVLGIIVVRGRARALRWVPALVAGGLYLAASVLEGVNAWPVLQYGYWTADSMAGAFVDSIQPFVWDGVFWGGVLCTAAAVGEYIGRDRAPATLAGYLEAFQGRLLAPAVIRSGVAGCAAGLVIMGYNALFWALASRVDASMYLCPHNECVELSTLTPGLDREDHAFADHLVPFVSGALDAVFWAMIMALAGWFFITIALRYVRSATATVLVVGALFGFLGPWVYPTALGSLGSGLAVVILGLILFRFGVLACMVAVYFSEIAATAIAMLATPGSGLALSGVALLGLAFLPALPWLVGRRRGFPVPALIEARRGLTAR